MTVRQWLADSAHRFQEEPIDVAAKATTEYLWRGVLRRVEPLFPAGTSVWERNWDICVVLDGCRFDVMEEIISRHAWLNNGNLEDIWSVGSSSADWMDRTFDDRYATELKRTIYITGNPHSASRTNSDGWAKLDEAWRSYWDEEQGTIPAEPLVDKAIVAHRTTDSPVLVHLMQPHRPFIGSNCDLGGGFQPGEGESGPTTTLWEEVRDGRISRNKLWGAYADTLDYALSVCEKLHTNVNGRVVFTADHGNGLGEWGVYEHPPRVPTPAIRRVPWLELRATDEDTYHPDVEISSNNQMEQSVDVTSRLQALGYTE